MEMSGPRNLNPPQRNCDPQNNATPRTTSRDVNGNMAMYETRYRKVTVCGDSDPWQSDIGSMQEPTHPHHITPFTDVMNAFNTIIN